MQKELDFLDFSLLFVFMKGTRSFVEFIMFYLLLLIFIFSEQVFKLLLMPQVIVIPGGMVGRGSGFGGPTKLTWAMGGTRAS